MEMGDVKKLYNPEAETRVPMSMRLLVAKKAQCTQESKLAGQTKGL
jgi:hypothetical protein